MGRLHFLRSRYELAEPLLLKAVDHPRFSFSSWLLLAKIAFLHGRVNQGRHRLLRALAANPRKFAKYRKGWITLSPLWMIGQEAEEEEDPCSRVSKDSIPSKDSIQSFHASESFEVEGLEQEELLPFERPDGTFSEEAFLEFFFGQTSFDEEEFDEEEDEEVEDEEELEDFADEDPHSWEISGSWDADWGSFLSDELFSRFPGQAFGEAYDESLDGEYEDQEEDSELEDPELDGVFEDSDGRDGKRRSRGPLTEAQYGEAQYWERFIKNPEFSNPVEARKFSLLPPIRHSEFRNLDWSYLQSRLFPKGGMPEEGAEGRS
ncbi:MAG TPA: hypothetical protein ENK02_02505 [Planctomycetes bacterium]|nr:hypothetical protein [Planctomycetota bacterium]